MSYILTYHRYRQHKNETFENLSDLLDSLISIENFGEGFGVSVKFPDGEILQPEPLKKPSLKELLMARCPEYTPIED